jgi:hypothetical protein
MTWNRRQFIGGVGMGTAAAWLTTQFPHVAFGQGEAGPPKRFVFVIEGNSVEAPNFATPAAKAFVGADEATRFYPRLYGHQSPHIIGSDGGAGNNLDLAAGLRALGGVNGQPSLVDDSAVILGLSSTITGGSHSTHCGALSCTRSSASTPAGRTIDALLAGLPQIRQTTPFEAIRLGVTGSVQQLTYYPSAFGVGTPAPVLNSPLLAYREIFGSVLSGEGEKLFRQRSKLLDFAKGDVDAKLLRFQGRAGELKLAGYQTAIRSLQERQRRLSEDQLSAQMSQYLPPVPTATNDPLIRLSQQFDVATGALRSGLTNVVVLASGTGNSGFNLEYHAEALPELTGIAGYSDEDGMMRHDLHHSSVDNPERIAVIHSASRFHVDQIARMARALKSHQEADGSTMLDNTTIVYMSDNGEQHHSSARDWPILVVGGRNMGLNLNGRTVIYPGIDVKDASNGPANRQVSNFFNTLTYAAGENIDTFGGEGDEGGGNRLKAGPLDELWGGGA